MDHRVIKSKITSPSISENFLFRDRLINKMMENTKTICLHAGAGYGKSVLLSQFAHIHQNNFATKNASISWVQINLEDNNIRNFMHCLKESIAISFTEFEFDTFNYNESEETPLEMLNDFILNLADIKLLENKELFIILDDFSKITCDKVLSSVEYLIENTAENIKFLIAVQNELPNFIWKKILDGKCEIIEQGELCFNCSEIFQMPNNNLFKTSEECEYTCKKTGGWPSAVKFSLMFLVENGLEHCEKIGIYDKNIMHSYIMHEIYNKFKSEIQYFLSATSLLENISAECCNYVLKINDADVIISNLAKENILIKNFEKGETTYSYHPIIKEFLMQRLNSEEKKKILENATNFQFKNCNREKCIDFAISSGNFEMTQAMIEKFGFDLLKSQDLQLLKKWVEYLLSQDKELTPKNYNLCGKYYYKINEMQLAINNFNSAMKILLNDNNTEEYAENAILKAVCIRNIETLEISNAVLDDVVIRFRGKDTAVIYSAMKEKVFNLIFISAYDEALGICTEMILTARRYKNKKAERIFAEISVIVYFYMGKYHKAHTIYQTFIHLKDDELGCFSSLPYIATLHAFYEDINVAKQMIDDGIQNKMNSDENRDIWVYFAFKAIIYSVLYQQSKDVKYLNEAIESCQKARQSIIFCDDTHEFCKFINAIHISIEKVLINLEKCDVSNIDLSAMINCHDFASSFSAGFLIYENLTNEIEMNEYTIKMLEMHRNKNNNIFWSIADIAKVLKLYAQKKHENAVKLAVQVKSFFDENKLEVNFLKNEQHELFKILGDNEDYGKMKNTESSTVEKIKIISMGNFEVYLPNEIKPIRFRTKKAKELFAWLFLMQGNSLEKDDIINELWPESTEKSATNLLHTALYNIRKTLTEHGFSDIIQCKNKNYYMSFDEVTSDIFAFSVIKKRVESEKNIDEKLCDEVITMHKGDFMQNIDCSFCLDSRRYYEREYLQLLETIYKKSIANKKYEIAVISLKKACEIDRYREEYYMGLMQCYSRVGDTKMIKDTYENMKKIFKKELEVEVCMQASEIYKKAIRKISHNDDFIEHETIMNSKGEGIWEAI